MNQTLENYIADGDHHLANHLGIEVLQLEHGYTKLRLPIKQFLFAGNGFLHAGGVVTLADTATGFGCLSSLPEGAESFTTIELKSNFAGTAREGALIAEAKLVHGGKMTQVWDATVSSESADGNSGKAIAHFRCTQMILYPKTAN